MLTILYIFLTYFFVVLFSLGWGCRNVPPQPIKEKSFGPGYKQYRDSLTRLWHYSNPDWVEWDKKFGDQYNNAHINAWLWPGFWFYRPFWLIFKIGQISSENVNKKIEKQKAEAARLKKISEDNEIELLKMRQQAEEELKILSR